MKFDLVPGYDAVGEIATLFTEYTAMLVKGDPAFKEYLDMQGYDDEVAHPADKYGMPEGRLYLARQGDAPVGCIALRKLDEERCELKRLYVRPAYRGHGLGERLVRRVMDDARRIGYKSIMLDTLPFLTTAIGMYHRLGFVDAPRYNDSPLDDTVYMRFDL